MLAFPKEGSVAKYSKAFRAANDAAGFLANLHFASALAGDIKGLVRGGKQGADLKQAREDLAAKMRRLSEEDSHIAMQFFDWLFQENRGNGPIQQFTSWWYANAFRSYVAQLPSSGDSDNAVNFLHDIVKIIKDEGGKERGYDAVLRYFSVMGVPHAPNAAFQHDVEAQQTRQSCDTKSPAESLMSWIDREHAKMEERNNAPGLRAAFRRWYRSMR